jgi:ABC-type phosphate transport system permease subunit
MMTILLTIVAVYVAIGIAVVITTNYAFVQKGGRLRTIRDSVPLVLAWPVVVYVLWAFSRG